MTVKFTFKGKLTFVANQLWSNKFYPVYNQQVIVLDPRKIEI